MALNRLDLGPSFGQNLVSSLGGSIEALTQNKLREIQHTQKMKGLESLGFSPEQAQSYSTLEPNLLQMIVQQKLQEPSQMAFAQGLQSILGGGAPESNIQQPEQQPQQMTQQQFEQLQQSVPHLMLPGNRPNNARALPGQPPVKQIPQQVLARLNPQQAMQLANLAIAQKQASAKENAALKKVNAEEQKVINKETLPYYNEVIKEDKAAKDIDLKTNRMIELIDKGKLPDAVYYKQLKDMEESLTPLKSIISGAGAGATSVAGVGAGIGGVFGGAPGAALGSAIGGLIGGVTGGVGGLFASRKATRDIGELRRKFPDTEEFEKLSASFISGAKAIFGSRVTDQDLKAFMQTVPQLSNSDAGKKAIINNIKLMNKAAHVKADTMKKIIKANGGNRPANLPILVDELAGPELDKLSVEFIRGI